MPPMCNAVRRLENWALKYSLAPDGKAFTATRFTRGADLWVMTGLSR
jgi:hypothetical protein